MGETCSRQGCELPGPCSEWSEIRHEPLFANLGDAFSGDLATVHTVREAAGFNQGLDGHLRLAPGLTTGRFAVVRTTDSAGSGANWGRFYACGSELGTGQSGVAFEGWALPKGAPALASRSRGDGVEASPGPPADPESSRFYFDAKGEVASEHTKVQGAGAPGAPQRAVALKKFRHKNSVAYLQELKVMLWIGTHPHVLRLLEVFESHEEDVMVLEYCQLGDVYEHYIRPRTILSEEHVAELMRQLLLGLEHLKRRTVEHRDVKPENLLLFHPPDGCDVPLVKLGDFGWALITDGVMPTSIPSEGVGSLWYAPPELNPPPPGWSRPLPLGPHGSSDMWSTGVITYLLLTGHSPFNVALRIKDDAERENEIMRLAALGKINLESPSWVKLSVAAKKFCLRTLQAQAKDRLSAEEALLDEFIHKAPRCPHRDAQDSDALSFALRAVKRAAWDTLDGLQRLGWLAAASAVTEPELISHLSVESSALSSSPNSFDASYVECLAMELASSVGPAWFHSQSWWAEVMHLAFRYLDVDMDGWLSVEDLACHVLEESPASSAQAWLHRWAQNGVLDFVAFHTAMQHGAICSQRSAADMVAPTGGPLTPSGFQTLDRSSNGTPADDASPKTPKSPKKCFGADGEEPDVRSDMSGV